MSDTITREDALAHFGVKGMHWGQRRTKKPPLSKGQKVVRGLKIGGTAVAVAGAAYAVHVVAKNGHVPVSKFHQPQGRIDYKDGSHKQWGATVSAGKRATQSLNQDTWRKSVDSLISDMQKAGSQHDLSARRNLNQLPAIVTNERTRKLIGL